MRTIKRFQDEIKLRLNRLSVDINLDDEAIVSQINLARADLFRFTKNIFPERYGMITRINLTPAMLESSLAVQYRQSVGGTYQNISMVPYKIPLPINFVEPWVVIYRRVEEEDTPINVECRLVDRKELRNIITHRWNKPSQDTPVYLCETKFEDEITSAANNMALHNNLGQTFNNPDSMLIYGIDKLTDLLSSLVEIWYIAKLPTLEAATDYTVSTPPANEQEISIPSEFDELLIVMATVNCLRKVNALEIAQVMEAEKQILMNVFSESHKIMHERKTIFLPSNETIERQ